MDKLTPKQTSKGAEEIVLTQIKQDFITPANAIFDYVDMAEKALIDAQLESCLLYTSPSPRDRG